MKAITLAYRVLTGLAVIAAASFVSADAQEIVPGSVQGKFTVSNGAANYSIPLAVPKGIGGMQPDLSLNYSSNGGPGIAGPGWSLGGLTAISRCRQTIVQDGESRGILFDGNDAYCLDGARLIKTGSNQYSTEIDTFSTVYAHGSLGDAPEYFYIESKAGLKMWLGKTVDSRLHLDKQTGALRWSVNRVEDRSGNAMTIEYEQGAEFFIGTYSYSIPDYNQRPSVIRYTENANAGLIAHQEVRFQHENDIASTNFALPNSTGTTLDTGYNSHRLKAIQFVLNGTVHNEYRLDYANSPNQDSRFKGLRKSVLTEIAYCEGGAGSRCLQPTRFTWEAPSSLFVSGHNRSVSNQWGGKYWHHVGDFDGDGFNDIGSASGTNIFLKRGYKSGFRSETWPVVGAGSITWGGHDFTYAGDFNGDGVTDLASAKSNYVYMKLSNPEKKRFDGEMWKLTSPYAGWGTSSNSWPGDFNGDGRTDIATALGSYIYVHFSTGEGFTTKRYSYPGGGSANRNNKNWVIDVDGDGRADIVSAHGSVLETYFIPTGTSTQVIKARGGSYSGDPEYTWIADFTCDGRPDIAYYKSSTRYLYTVKASGRKGMHSIGSSRVAIGGIGPKGMTWAADFDGDNCADLLNITADNLRVWSKKNGRELVELPAKGVMGDRWHTWMGDFNGDGGIDIASASAGTIGVRQSRGTRADVITGFTDTARPNDPADDSTILVEYKPASDATVYGRGGRVDYPKIRLTPPGQLVSKVSYPDGAGNHAGNAYFYRNFTVDMSGRGPLGFEHSTVSDLANGTSDDSWFALDFPFIGMAKEETSRRRDLILSHTVNVLNSQTTKSYGGNSSVFAFASESKTEAFDVDGTLLTRSTNTSAYDTYGNVTTAKAIVRDIPNNIIKSTTTTNTYGSNIQSRRFGRLSRSVVHHRATNRPTLTRVSSFEYDPQTLLLSAEVIEPDAFNAASSDYLRKEYIRDPYGETRKTTSRGFHADQRAMTRVGTSTMVVRPNEIDVTTCAYPTGSESGLSVCSKNTVDRRHGGGIRAVDANGVESRTEFDGFGRVEREVLVTGGSAVTKRTDRAFAGGLTDAVTVTKLTGSDGSYSEVHKDALGRTIQKRWRSLDGRFVSEETEFDRLGLIRSQSRPHFENGASPNRAVMRYDELARLVETHRPGEDGLFETTTYTYDGFNKTTTTSREGIGQVFRTEYKNGLGELVRVVEGNGAASTSFEYDAMGNLRFTTNAANARTEIRYNRGGNKTMMIDPAMGQWEYSYNSFGELESQKDAKSQITEMAYDGMGRMVSRLDAGAAGSTTWTYDTATKGLGKLASVSQADGYKKLLSYDSRSRLATTKIRIPGAVGSNAPNITTGVGYMEFAFQNFYDNLNRISRVVRPGGAEFHNEYGQHGHLVAVKSPRTNSGGGESYSTAHLVSRISSLNAQRQSLRAQAEAWKTEASVFDSEAETFDLYADIYGGASDSVANTVQVYRRYAEEFRHQSEWANDVAGYFDELAAAYDEQFEESAALINNIQGWDDATRQVWIDYYRDYYDGLAAGELESAEEFNTQAAQHKSREATYRRSEDIYFRYVELHANNHQMYVELAQQKIASANRLREKARSYDDLQEQADSLQAQVNAGAWAYWWRASETDAEGRITQEAFGNGLQTTKYYNPATGRLESIQTTAGTWADIQSLLYTYDEANNVRSRQDFVTGSNDSFEYDALDRLTHATFQQGTTTQSGALSALNKSFSWSYDSLGNINSRSEGGQTWAYTYAQGLGGPKLTNVTGFGALRYDANGAIEQTGDRAIAWSSFGKPTQITSSKGTVSLSYGPERARYRKLDHPAGGDLSETLYVGGGFERTRTVGLTGSRVVHTHSIMAGGRRIAAQIKTSVNGDDTPEYVRTTYFHDDALGSVEVATNHLGEVVKRYRYDPFGKRHDITQIDIDQNRDGQISLADASQALSRGYTGHEEIDTAGIVHMNGRVYDTVLQRFLSADPLIQAPNLSQSHNRYAYVMNNPLKYTDPTGFSWWSKTWKKIKRAIKKYWRQIVAIAITVWSGGLAAGAASSWAAAGYAFAGGFAAALVVSGGDLRAALIGGLTALAMFQVGQWVTGGGTAKVTFKTPGLLVKKVIGHGAIGGASSAAQGGKFADGFWGSASSALATPFIDQNVHSHQGQLLAAAVVGGTAASVGGGKFANGAVFGAMSYAFNNCLSGGCRFFSKYDGQAMRAQARTAVEQAGKEAMAQFVDVAKSDGLGHVSDATAAVAIGCGAAGMAPCAAAAGAVSTIAGTGQVAVEYFGGNHEAAAMEGAKLANSMSANAAANSAVRHAPGPVGRVVGVSVQTMAFVGNQLGDQPRDNYVEK